MDARNLAAQTLESSAAKALKGLGIAQKYMNYGFTTLRDLGSVDPEWPTIDLRNALNSGLVERDRGSSLRRTLLVQALGTATSAASMPRAGTCPYPPSLTISGASRRWCGASTPSAATGSRPPTPAVTSAAVTIRRG